MDSTASFIFLPKVPLMNPRTLWACHAVAAMMLLSVAPPGRFSSSRSGRFCYPGALSAAFWAWVGFLADFALAGATGGFRFVALAFAVGFGSGAVPAAT
jgi:hypothetical protein